MSFDTLAPHYRWMEFILAGEKLQRCRTAFLDEIPTPQRILLLGEGHGRCYLECCRRFPNAQITCLDASAKMLAQTRRRFPNKNNVIFVHADILNWTPPENAYDLIVTNFFLDCFRADQLEQIISKIGRSATREASWLISDFQIASGGLKRFRSKLILRVMYLFFRINTGLPARELTAPNSNLEHAGFTLSRRIEKEWGLLHSDWWERK